jgi:hypothetical protein
MPQDQAQARAAIGGKFLSAPLGTAAPASVIAAFGAGWVDLGYMNEDGPTFREGRESEEFKGWPGPYVLRRLLTGKSLQMVTPLLQWNKDTIVEAFAGGAITGVGDAIKFTPPAIGTLRQRALALEWTDGTLIYRWIVLKAVPGLEDLEISFNSNTLSELPITWGIEVTSGVDPWYFLTNDPAYL